MGPAKKPAASAAAARAAKAAIAAAKSKAAARKKQDSRGESRAKVQEDFESDEEEEEESTAKATPSWVTKSSPRARRLLEREKVKKSGLLEFIIWDKNGVDKGPVLAEVGRMIGGVVVCRFLAAERESVR